MPANLPAKAVEAAGEADRETIASSCVRIAETSEQMDAVMARLERAGIPICVPIRNEPQDLQIWLDEPRSPKPERPPQDPVTVPYEVTLEQWTGESE